MQANDSVTVSATLIVKNEEKVLARCLESIKDAVDEIVVADTGSEDGTRAIAGRYTDRIVDFSWRKDFAAARQFALDHATCGWAFWIDADDIVRNAENIRSLAQRAAESVGTIYWPYVVGWDEHGNVTTQYWRERLVRNDGRAAWRGRIHEVLGAPGEIEYSKEVVVEHHQLEGRNNLVRNIDIMETERSENGDSPRLLFYLGRDYMSSGELDKSLEAFERYLEIAIWMDEKYQAQTKVAQLYRMKEDFESAIDADLAALKIHPTWPDAYFGLAKTYYFLKDWPKVVHWSEIGETLAEPDTTAILNPMDYRFNWIIYYTNGLYHVGRLEDALRWTKEALAIRPDDPWHRENETNFTRALRRARQGTTAR